MRRIVEAAAAIGGICIAVGVALLVGLAWALVTGGALLIAFALLIVDVPTRTTPPGPQAADRRR